MQIVVEITDELVARVQARGLTPENYVRGLIEGAEGIAPLPLRLRHKKPSVGLETHTTADLEVSATNLRISSKVMPCYKAFQDRHLTEFSTACKVQLSFISFRHG